MDSCSLVPGLLETLHARFNQNMPRHPGVDWADVLARLSGQDEKVWSLSEMERTGGEPDVVVFGPDDVGITFVDCAPESPVGRRSLCYDEAALNSRKANKPVGSAVGVADEMGISLLREDEYHALQDFGEFDLKTSSWVLTHDDVRALGGAIFCDCRFGRVFTYHNGVESYYASRGFRGKLRI